jgi:hypothetical protein
MSTERRFLADRRQEIETGVAAGQLIRLRRLVTLPSTADHDEKVAARRK